MGIKLYDLYEKGIRNAELTMRDDRGSKTYTIKKRDIKSNRWSSFGTASESDLAGNRAFDLWGTIKFLPAALPEIERLDWKSRKAVGGLDQNSIYVRHGERIESVGDQKVRAYYWALEDGVEPMDIVIGPDNELIAGLDLFNDICLVQRGYENFTNLKAWTDPTITPAKFGYRDLGKIMVDMSDGVRLATLVYLPDDGTDGPYPVVFIRSPYGIGEARVGGIDVWWHYCARGYALVFQAVRGTAWWDPENMSEGIWELGVNEARDGAEALAWIIKQPWCDGNIGMQGVSYLAHTQWAVAMAGNPALKCIIPEVSMGTAFGDMPYVGGGLHEGSAFYGFWLANLDILPERSWSEILRHRPLIEIDQFATGKKSSLWQALLEHHTHDDYWKQSDWYLPEYSIDVPALHIGGWFDDDFVATRRSWELMHRKHREYQRLILGPWRHRCNRDRTLNALSLGTDAVRGDIWLLKQRWYDRFLKGIDNNVEEPVVEYYVLGKDEWRISSQWPPEGMEEQKWYLHSTGQAHELTTDGSLSIDPPEAAEPVDTYQYDPDDPAPNWTSYGEMDEWEDIQRFPCDAQQIEVRRDVVVYTSLPLEEDLTIAGDITAVLHASCNVRDTDWWVQLSDVDQEGRSLRLTSGMLRARFRNLEDKRHHVFGSNFEKEELLSANVDDVVRYDINVPSIAVTFKKGHCIRIAVMNACDNYCFPNSNTGENEAYVTETVVGAMAIHHTPSHPSHVVLPVLFSEVDGVKRTPRIKRPICRSRYHWPENG